MVFCIDKLLNNQITVTEDDVMLLKVAYKCGCANILHFIRHTNTCDSDRIIRNIARLYQKHQHDCNKSTFVDVAAYIDELVFRTRFIRNLSHTLNNDKVEFMNQHRVKVNHSLLNIYIQRKDFDDINFEMQTQYKGRKIKCNPFGIYDDNTKQTLLNRESYPDITKNILSHLVKTAGHPIDDAYTIISQITDVKVGVLEGITELVNLTPDKFIPRTISERELYEVAVSMK